MSGPFSTIMSKLIRFDSNLTLDNGVPTEAELNALKNRNALAHFTEGALNASVRMNAARGLVRKAFAAAVFHLGETEALRVWANASKKRPGGRTGSRKPDKDKLLMEYYDQLVQGDRRKDSSLPRFLGGYLEKHYRGEYGQSSGAIEKKIRRLLKLRQEAAAFAEAPARPNPFRMTSEESLTGALSRALSTSGLAPVGRPSDLPTVTVRAMDKKSGD